MRSTSFPYRAPAPKRQISLGGGTRPVWSRDGRELYYPSRRSSFHGRFGRCPTRNDREADGAADYRAVGIRQSDAEDFGHPGYDVSPEGRLLIVEQAPEESAPGEIQVVLNWFEELKRRVPTGSRR